MNLVEASLKALGTGRAIRFGCLIIAPTTYLHLSSVRFYLKNKRISRFAAEKLTNDQPH